MMAHVDLCSGIGGFALGFQWAGLSKPVLFCDIEPWSRKVLAKHWPDVPIATDVKELANDPDRNVPDCDILTAGYPCQPFSHAGKRLGDEDDRHIWPYLLQIVAHKRPAFCVFENVYGHVSMGLDQVLLDLEAQGYASRTFIVPACGVDAPHRRDRIWIIAHTDSHREPNGPVNGSQGQRLDVGNAGCVTKRQSLSRFSKEQFNCGTQSQRSVTGHRFADTSENVANTDSQRGRLRNTQRQDAEDAGQPSRHTRDNTRGMESWLPEPSVGRVANGIPKRVDRLRGLGNAIVPQIAQKIGEAIKQCEAEL